MYNSSLFSACLNGDVRQVQKLLKSGSNPDAEAALHAACDHVYDRSHFQVARVLLDSGASVNLRAPGGWPNYGRTSLHLACLKCGRERNDEEDITLDFVRLLLDHQAELEAVDGLGMETPLHMACSNGHLGVVRELLDRGANIEAVDGNNRTPLFKALVSDFHTAIDLLLSRGASVNAVDCRGNTVFHAACDVGKIQVMRNLLEHSTVNINARNNCGATPLVQAIRCGCNAEVIKAMLASGASANIGDTDDWTPLHYTDDALIAEALLDAGADIDSRTSDGETAVEIACGRCNSTMVQLLLLRGASFSDVDHLIAKINTHGNAFPISVDEAMRLVEFLSEFSPSMEYLLK